MRKNVNMEIVEGRVFQHNLVEKVSGAASKNPGTKYISGTIDVATDEDCLNVISVHYTYVTEKTKNGDTNRSYANLKQIMEGNKTVTAVGKEEAVMVKLQPSADLNEFYPRGSEELKSIPRNEGGFVSIVSHIKTEGLEGKDKNGFMFDTLITNVARMEANPEKGINAEYDIVRCAIFNFRNEILPFTLVVKNPVAMDYFEGLNASASEPVYTKVWGRIVNTTVQEKKEIESAFGEPVVDVTERKVREWEITGAQREPYEFNTEATITVEEVTKAMADREVKLADIKRQRDEYQQNAATTNAAAPTPAAAGLQIPQGGFNF